MVALWNTIGYVTIAKQEYFGSFYWKKLIHYLMKKILLNNILLVAFCLLNCNIATSINAKLK